MKNVKHTYPIMGFTLIYGMTSKIHCDVLDIYKQQLFVEQISNCVLNVVSYNMKWLEIG